MIKLHHILLSLGHIPGEKILVFFAQDTMRIISNPKIFIRGQYLIIFASQRDSHFFTLF
jgi:hypothetical protein